MGFYWLWLKRVLFSSRMIFQYSSLFSLFGLILAVASLTVALLVVNGFSSGLEKILIDQQGHLRIQAKNNILKEELLKDISAYKKEYFSNQALFLSFEGLIVKDSHFKGVFFEAVQDEKLKSLSFLKNHILEGNLESNQPFVVLGSDLAKELNLSVGSISTVIVSQSEDSYFSKKQAHFKVGAIADFGRYELNSSFVFLPLSFTKVLGFDRVSGMNVWIKNADQTNFLKQKMEHSLKDSYIIRSWKDIDRAFFAVVESDKKIIFFVLFILIVAAGFNISSSLFVQVFRKTKDISILRAMGAKKKIDKKLVFAQWIDFGLVWLNYRHFSGSFCMLPACFCSK